MRMHLLLATQDVDATSAVGSVPDASVNNTWNIVDNRNVLFHLRMLLRLSPPCTPLNQMKFTEHLISQIFKVPMNQAR